MRTPAPPSSSSIPTPRHSRKRRARVEPRHADQHHAAIATYRDPDVQRKFNGMRGDIVEVMLTGTNFTAAEVRDLVRQGFGHDSPESTVYAQIHALFHLGVVTDHDTPDRECRISGRFKKTWRLLRTGEQLVLTTEV